MSIESVLKESVERADRRGRLSTLADDLMMFCRMYVKKPLVPVAMEVMLRLCYRFGQITIEERDAHLKELVAVVIRQRQPVWNNRVFLFGVFYGALWSLVMLAIVIFI